MNAPPLVPVPTREGIQAALVAAGAVDAPMRNEQPVLVAAGQPVRVVWANPAACALFGASTLDALSDALFGAGQPVTSRLAQVVQRLEPGASPRLERVRVSRGATTENLTFQVRKLNGADAPTLFSGIGIRAPLLAHAPVSDALTLPQTPEPVAATPASAAPQPEPSRQTIAASQPFGHDDDAPRRSFDDVQAELKARFGTTRLVRFLWQTDGEGRLRTLTNHLCEAVGCMTQSLIGQHFAQLARAWRVDTDGRLAAVLAGQHTWSNVEVAWPVLGADAALPVSLGALPAFTADRRFDGFRGYGIIHVQDARRWPDEPTASAQTADEPAAEQPAAAPAAEAVSRSVHSLGENVVRLRIATPQPRVSGPSRALTLVPASPPTLDVDGHPAPRDTDSVELSPGERLAFREIARALGARVKDDGVQPSVDVADSVAPEPAGNGYSPAASPPDGPSDDLDEAATPPETIAAQPPVAEPAAHHPAETWSDVPSAADIRDPAWIGPVEYDPAATQNVETGAGQARDLLQRVTEASQNWQAGGSDTTPDAPVEVVEPQAETTALAAADEAYLDTARAAPGPAPVHPAAAEMSLLDALPQPLVIVQNGEAVIANAAFLALTGHADLDAFRAAGGLAHTFRDGLPETSDAREAGIALTLHDGDVATFDMQARGASWNGTPARLLTFTRETDLARRNHGLERDLRQRETEARELHAILDTATDGVAVLDESGNILALNRAGQALFGYDQNDVVGQSFTTLLLRESQSEAQAYLDGLKTNGVATLLNDGREVVGRAHQGGSIPLFMTLGRVGAGGAPKFCAVLRDLTPWKRAERELKDARRDAERANALKSEFLAKVSHEVRTPLNAILGFAEVIMEERFGPIGNARYKDYLKDIHASGSHVMSLVNDLLDLSKIEAGKMDLATAAVDANRVITECVSLMQPQANTERVIVRMSLAPRLPQVLADERSLRQIVINLLSNAVKFNEPGGQVIVSTALTDAGYVVVRIRDTGVGMSEADLEVALEPFRQVATSRHVSGTGLGLPLTKALVEANRASFTIKSRKDEGTLVEVAFPPNCVLAG